MRDAQVEKHLHWGEPLCSLRGKLGQSILHGALAIHAAGAGAVAGVAAVVQAMAAAHAKTPTGTSRTAGQFRTHLHSSTRKVIHMPASTRGKIGDGVGWQAATKGWRLVSRPRRPPPPTSLFHIHYSCVCVSVSTPPLSTPLHSGNTHQFPFRQPAQHKRRTP